MQMILLAQDDKTRRGSQGQQQGGRALGRQERDTGQVPDRELRRGETYTHGKESCVHAEGKRIKDREHCQRIQGFSELSIS